MNHHQVIHELLQDEQGRALMARLLINLLTQGESEKVDLAELRKLSLRHHVLVLSFVDWVKLNPDFVVHETQLASLRVWSECSPVVSPQTGRSASKASELA